MTLPFKCCDCGGPITLTTDEALAIYQSRINLCQSCIDSLEEDRYDDEVECSWDPERRAFVARAPVKAGSSPDQSQRAAPSGA